MMSSIREEVKYSRANSDQDSTEHLLSDEERHVRQPPECRTTFWRRVLRLMPYILGTLLACFFAGIAGFFMRHDLDGVCAVHTAQHSPLVDVISYHEQPFNGSFLKETIFRKDPSREVDEAWASLGTEYHAIRASPEDARKAGIPEDYVKINEKHGGGYPVNVEGFHHLHCLNLLRQTNYYNYEHYRDLGSGAFKNDEFVVKRHVTHCLDIIRQQLMCNVDVGIFGQVWLYPDHPEPFVDFNTQHKCRNFDQLREWVKERQLPEKVPHDFLQPPKKTDRIYSEVP